MRLYLEYCARNSHTVVSLQHDDRRDFLSSVVPTHGAESTGPAKNNPCGARESAAALQRRQLPFRRPPSFALATFDAHKPAVCFRRSEQAPIAVPAVGILAEPARTIRRHRAAHQRQARCLAQQIGSSRNLHCRRTAHNARRDFDRAEIAGGVRPLMFSDWLRCRWGVRARDFAKELFQFLDHDGVPLIDKGLVNMCAICPPNLFIPYAAQFRHDHRREQCHRQRVFAVSHV
jgi:hypothetical protein